MSTTPYKEGKAWAVRVRRRGINRYESGFRTKDDARRWATALELGLEPVDPRQGPGSAPASATAPEALPALPAVAFATNVPGLRAAGLTADVTLAAALGEHCRKRTGKQKGAGQSVARVNVYLEAAGLPTLRAVPMISETKRVALIASGGSPTAGRAQHFTIEEVDPSSEVPLKLSLARERERRRARGSATFALRCALASITVADLENLEEVMSSEGYASATIRQEFALLSVVFKYARKTWRWKALEDPTCELTWPKGSAYRNRVLSAEERVRLLVELARSHTPFLLPWLVFAIETTMRKSEILRDLLWSQVNFEARTARLHDSKGGPRDVPLTRAALDALEELPRGQAWERVFPISAEALDAAWKRACERAGIANLPIHDLRHTGATIHAKAFKGDIFLLKKVTGHKTISQLARYVNYDMSDVLEAFDAADARAAANAAALPLAAAPQVEVQARVAGAGSTVSRHQGSTPPRGVPRPASPVPRGRAPAGATVIDFAAARAARS